MVYRRKADMSGEGSPKRKQPIDKKDKVDYVRSQKQTRDHRCHWPGCDRQVPPAMWGCKEHWMKLPKYLRDLIWESYRPGQEVDMRPSREYLDAVEQAQQWILEHHPPENSDGESTDADE